ncbi:hypothetical protein NSA19_12845 [Actinomyces bowdenii]|uniref:hypothetical protein n=1 Tax=Actinomyces bowdenii TaxID=131109 RepID=UPI00214CE243|nr:hypothetical protein [Actinomyces bowdenii]MCR2053708.1 hypothetical protein [Actinomyces bowdenii]
MEDYMLDVEDVEGAVSSGIQNFNNDSGCTPVTFLLHGNNSLSEDFPQTEVKIELDGGEVVWEALIYDAASPERINRFQDEIARCVKISPFTYYDNFESSEVVEFIDASELPEGVVGYTSVVTNVETGEKRTVQRIFLRFDHEGKKGMMYLSVMNPSGEPADLSPVELIDPALRNAEATLDHTGLDSSTPSPAPTTTAGTSEAPSATDSPTQSSE